MTPRVSVIVATRNRRRQLARALASVDAQRYRDFEVLVIDDGSEDGTVQWLRSQQRSACIVDTRRQRGAAASRNQGVALARGEIVAFLDDDDAWRPAYLDTQVRQFDADKNVEMCTTGHVEIDPAGRVFEPDLGPSFPYSSRRVQMLAECPVHSMSLVACRRSAFARIGGFDEGLEIVHDLDWYARLLAAGGRLAHTRAVLVERAVPGGLVTRHRHWFVEERAVHDRLCAGGFVAPSERRRIRAARSLLFARMGFAKGDLSFGLTRLVAAFAASPATTAHLAVQRFRRRARRDATGDAWRTHGGVSMTIPAGSTPPAAMAVAPAHSPPASPVYVATRARAITRRGILWLGQTCNLRCHFCYFLDRIEDDLHPEHAFMSIEKAKAICRTLVDYYGNNAIDIQGGEPTLYPSIYELVAYCAEIGLSPTLITNAIALSGRDRVLRFKQAGLRDFLISVQGLGDVYDRIVGRTGSHARQMQALRHLQDVGIPFRFNTVLSRAALPQLVDIASLAIQTGAGVVNFLGFNPFNDQRTGKRSTENVPSYAALREPLEAALDLLASNKVEANVRYLPLCLLADRHKPSAYGFKQLPYDLHENDYASWSWTDLPAQRSTVADLTPPFGLGRRLRLGPWRAPLRRLDRRLPWLGTRLHLIKQDLERSWATLDPESRDIGTLEQQYQHDAEVRAREYTGYRYVAACKTCDIRPICDGVYGDYVDMFGLEGIRPVISRGSVTDPQHYTRHQYKVIHPLDRRWLDEKVSRTRNTGRATQSTGGDA